MPRKPKIVTQFHTTTGNTAEEAARLARLLHALSKKKRPGRPVRSDRLGIAFAIAQCIGTIRISPRTRKPHRGIEPMREELAVTELIRVFSLRRDGQGRPRPDTLTIDNATRIIEQARRLLSR